VTLNLLLVVVLVMFGALATPWAAGLRAHFWPQLPILIVVLCTLSGAAQVVHGLVTLQSARNGWSQSAFSLLSGASGLFLALTFLPAASGLAPRASTLWASALCAILAAALQRREHLRSAA
jgi:hypothetical protein